MDTHYHNPVTSKKELWLNIANYHFEHLVPVNIWDTIVAKFGGHNPSTKAFADKLSRKLNWEKKFAFKAIWEYKKFVYLGVMSDFSVTPSKIIDQVWHEHILFSAGYREFCQEIIQYNFDHNPELVSLDNQTETFQAQYFHTIELYKIEFGIEPPVDIWGKPKFKGKTESSNGKKKMKDKGRFTVELDLGVSLISMFPNASSRDVEFAHGEFGGDDNDSGWEDDVDDGPGGDDGDSDGSSCSSCSSSCGGGCGGD